MKVPDAALRHESETVTVILPYFNRTETLERAARSVLTQTHQDLIMIMVDDGSTDDSREVARSLQDSRIVHVDAVVNGGATAARNLGLREAATDLIAFQDSDDEWFPEKLEKQLGHLRFLQRAGHSVSVLGCAWRYEGKQQDRLFEPGPFGRLDMLRGISGTSTPVLLVDRAVAAQAEFDDTFPSLEERDYVIQLLSNGSLLAVLPEVLAVVTRGRSDHVANPRDVALAYRRYISKYDQDISDNPEIGSWYHFRAAREYLVARMVGSERKHIRQALRYDRTRRAVHLFLGRIAGARGFALAQKVVPIQAAVGRKHEPAQGSKARGCAP